MDSNIGTMFAPNKGRHSTGIFSQKLKFAWGYSCAQVSLPGTLSLKVLSHNSPGRVVFVRVSISVVCNVQPPVPPVLPHAKCLCMFCAYVCTNLCISTRMHKFIHTFARKHTKKFSVRQCTNSRRAVSSACSIPPRRSGCCLLGWRRYSPPSTCVLLRVFASSSGYTGPLSDLGLLRIRSSRYNLQPLQQGI